MTDFRSQKVPRADLAKMSDQDLLDVRNELSAAMGRASQEMQRMRANIERVKNELKMRQQGNIGRGDPIVSDHAVVRYLERHKGVDIIAVRDEIRAMAKRAKYERDEKKGERLRDEQSGVALVWSTERNSIATILSGDAEALIDGKSTAG